MSPHVRTSSVSARLEAPRGPHHSEGVAHLAALKAQDYHNSTFTQNNRIFKFIGVLTMLNKSTLTRNGEVIASISVDTHHSRSKRDHGGSHWSTTPLVDQDVCVNDTWRKIPTRHKNMTFPCTSPPGPVFVITVHWRMSHGHNCPKPALDS